MQDDNKVVDNNLVVGEVENDESQISPIENESDAPEESTVVEVDTTENTEDDVEIIDESTKAVENETSDSSLEKEVPFNQNPKFEERIKEIDEKYGNIVSSWNALWESSGNDPAFKLSLIKKLEDIGKFPKGSYEMAQAKLGVNKTPQKEAKKTEQNVPEDLVKQIIESNPDIQYARQLRAEQVAKAEEEYQKFEDSHPDIREGNSEIKRANIGFLAKNLMAERGLDRATALEKAYVSLYGGDEAIEKAREQARLETKLESQQVGVAGATAPRGTDSTKTRVRLTAEENQARLAIGCTPEEYLLYKNPQSGMVD